MLLGPQILMNSLFCPPFDLVLKHTKAPGDKLEIADKFQKSQANFLDIKEICRRRVAN